MKIRGILKKILKLFRDIYWAIIYANISIFHRLEKTGFRIHNNVVTISQSSKNAIIETYKIKEKYIKIIPNGINMKIFKPSNFSNEIRDKYGNNILLYTGLMVQRKKIPVLLKAMPYVIEKIPDVNLLLTGKGSLLNKYIKLAESLGIQNNTTFLGFVSERKLLKYYATSDIYVFPSILEGFGQVLLEAMASGTPVICADKPPMSNIIENGGITFERNNPLDLSQKIIELLKNREKLNHLGENALKVAKKYEWSKIAESYYQYCKQIVKSNYLEK